MHPHMLRHACGFKLANDGVDSRTFQPQLCHSAQGFYLDLAPTRFKTCFGLGFAEPSAYLRNFSRELITPNAIQLLPEATPTTFLSGHPWSLHPRRVVAHVLSVPTFQFGDPVVFGVHVKSGDLSFHVLPV